MKEKLDIMEAPEDVWPICPHCRKELRFIWVKSKGTGFIERKQFLFCPHCRAFLGFGNINYTCAAEQLCHRDPRHVGWASVHGDSDSRLSTADAVPSTGSGQALSKAEG